MANRNVLYSHACNYFVGYHLWMPCFEMHQKQCTVVELQRGRKKESAEKTNSLALPMSLDARLLICYRAIR